MPGMVNITANNMATRFKKGSKEAKAFMAKIRAKKAPKVSVKGNWSLKDRKQLASELGEDFYNAADWKKLTGKTKGKKVGATLYLEQGETRNTKPNKVVSVKRKQHPPKAGTFQKFSRIAGVKKHTGRAVVVKKETRKTGFSIGSIVKTFLLSELKKLNPVYFAKGNDKFFGVVGRKLFVSKKLNCQVMAEKHHQRFSHGYETTYSIREVSPTGELKGAKSFETLLQLHAYVDKTLKF
jgi:hypothetical protein